MDAKQIGLVLIALAVLFLVSTLLYKSETNRLVDQLMLASGGSCMDASGRCLHEASNLPVYSGLFAAAVSGALGLYLLLFHKSVLLISKSQETLARSIVASKQQLTNQERFDALLKGLDEATQSILKIVKAEEGITQSTLVYRTGFSKTKISLVLKDLEKKKLITRQKKGKINRIFLKAAI